MVYSFACSIAAWIDSDWKLVTRVVDFKVLQDKEHEGEQGGLAFVNGVRQRGGLEKMSRKSLEFGYIIRSIADFGIRCYYFKSLTTDNASVNDVLVKTVSKKLLKRYNVPYTPDSHIRCFAHIVNLIVQAFLASMDEAPDPDDEDQYADITDYPLHYDVDAEDEQIALKSEKLDKSALKAHVADALDEEFDCDKVRGMSALKRVCSEFTHHLSYLFSPQLRFITLKITSSPQ